MKKLKIFGMMLFILILSSNSCKKNEKINQKDEEVEIINNEPRTTPNWQAYKKMKIDFRYNEIYPDLDFQNLHMPGLVSRWGVQGYVGKFSRALRFKNITDAVENRYNLPDGIVFAMMVEESSGMDLLPNGLGDGGYGLCHMQPPRAQEFGLKTFKDCDGMVCNGKDRRSCVVNKKKCNHALDLKRCIINFNYDRKILIEYDDRLNPIANLDAVGRMLACYMDGPPKKLKKEGTLGPLRTSVCRYSGSVNYKAYWRDLMIAMNHFNDKQFIKNLEIEFNKINPDLRINGKKAGFKEYIKLSQQQSDNYGLKEYKKLPKYQPKNSEVVKKSIKNFL